MNLSGAIKNRMAEAWSIAKLKPIMFIAMLFSIVYGLATACISTVQLSFYMGITASYSLILGINKFFALRKYKLIQNPEQPNPAEIEKNTAKNITICTAVLSFLHFSFAIVSTFYYEEDATNYGFWVLCFTSATAFIKIVLNVIQSIRTRKNHSMIIHHLKLSDSAASLIALALAQRSILYYAGYEYAKTVSGIIGVFCSLVAGVISLIMFKKFKDAAGIKSAVHS